MKKYIASLLAILLFISNVSVASAASYNLITTSFRSLLSQTSMKVNMTVKQRYPDNPMISQFNMMNSDYNQSTVFSVEASQDISTPGNVKASQAITISGPLISMFGLKSKVTIENRIIGDTIYLKIPATLLNSMANNLMDTQITFQDTWIQISQSDVNNLSTDMSFIGEMYSYLTTFNSQPMQYILNQKDLWSLYTQAFKVNKTGSKVVNGKKVNVFNVTFDKAAYKKALIANMSDQYSDGKIPAYVMKSINSEAESIKVKNMSFSLYADSTNLPYSLSGSIYFYDTYSKKLSTITDLDMKFSNYGLPYTPEVPASYMTATQFFNQYIKPALDQARIKGAEASIKSMVSNMRAQAEIIYATNNLNAYGTASNSGNCTNPTPGSLFNYPTNEGDSFKALVSSIINQGGTNTACYSTPQSWAFSVTLKSGKNYCVDSTGVAKDTNSPASSTACPQ